MVSQDALECNFWFFQQSHYQLNVHCVVHTVLKDIHDCMFADTQI